MQNMRLTIDQALHQGVAAHSEGKLQEAETLYSAILQSQSNHPDANYNLGLLRVNSGEAAMALLLFEKAIAINSSEEKFWLSYIETLIWERQRDDARTALTDAAAAGFAGEKWPLLIKNCIHKELAVNCLKTWGPY